MSAVRAIDRPSMTIRLEQDAARIVVLTLDDPEHSANTMNASYAASMAIVIDELEARRADIAGVIITSAKRTFLAGADLNDLRDMTGSQVGATRAMRLAVTSQLRRLETLGVPVVAAITGSALGGGLELALATHHRIVLDDAAIGLGLPEVTLGLMPGAGGVVRSVRTLGVLSALSQLLLDGRALAPRDAQTLGLVDEVVAHPAALNLAAREWIVANPGAQQPWDRPGHEIPGGTPSSPQLAAVLPTLPATLRKKLGGADQPAARHIMSAAVEGSQVDFDSAIEIEGRYFMHLATGQVAHNMIQTFFDRQRVLGKRGRSRTNPPVPARKMVVLGAGMMGAAIAYVAANAGIDVVLKDVSPDAAARGRGYSERLLAAAVGRRRITEEHAGGVLARITPTDDMALAAGADVVIEAVFEDPAVKAEVFTEAQRHVAAGALLGSNTSTLPISSIASAVSRPQDFIGLHFFSPVEKMPLLEIIRGAQTSDATLHRALDLAKQLGKVPIVVNDSRGFFTSRVIATFINEGIAMLLEGVPPASIEQASAQAGYPATVLALADELNLGLLRRVREEAKAAAGREDRAWAGHPAEAVIDRMLDEFGRTGRRDGAGFYDYHDGARTRLWPGLDQFAPPAPDPSFGDLKERLLFIESLEAVRCLDGRVIETIADANIGSLLGIGYPRWTGGVFGYINGYRDAVAGFVTRADELAEAYGERFAPPASLRAVANRGEKYRDPPETPTRAPRR